MKRSALLVLSSLLLTSASYAGNTKCEDCYDLSTKHAAALHHTVSKPNSAETKYWDDYIHSGNKDITVYVRDLSRKDAQAALWFITTGGKHGFAARQATAQERVLLEDAIKQVALSYSQQGVKSGRGLEEWSQVSNANHAGHLHLQMIYRQIDNLNFKVDNLNIRVTALEADLKAEREARENLKLAAAAEKTNHDKSAAEEVRLIALITQNQKDAEKKLADQKLADKTAADALLETEKAKIQEEVNRQKGRKRHYKDQLADYKEKEAEARQAAAIAKAVKEQQEAAAKEREAAALKERQRDEEIKKEREAAAKEREAAALKERQRDEEIKKEREAAAKEREAAALKERQRDEEIKKEREAAAKEREAAALKERQRDEEIKKEREAAAKEREAAALKERQRDEEIRKEREAWAKEKEIILAALAKSGHLPSGMNSKLAPPAPNSPTITINGANK